MNLLKSKILMLIAIFSIATAFSASFANTTYAGWVKGYTKSDGTYVNGYWRSNPNGLKYDNYSFDGDWSDAYNDSYFSSSRNYSSDWYKPSWVTQDDYYVGKNFYDNRNSYSTYTNDLYDYDYSYWDDPIYKYTPSYNYGYNYFDSLDTYESPYASYDDYDSSSLYGSSSYNSYTSPYSSSLYDYGSSSSYDTCSTSLYSTCSNSSYSSPYSSSYDSSYSPYSSSYYDSYSSPSYGSSYNSSSYYNSYNY